MGNQYPHRKGGSSPKEPGRQTVRVEGDGSLDAGEKEDAASEIEGQGGGDGGPFTESGRADADGGGGGDALKQEEDGLAALHAAESDAEDVFVDDGGQDERDEDGADGRAADAPVLRPPLIS